MEYDFYYISFTAGKRFQQLRETVTCEKGGGLFHVFVCLSYLSSCGKDIFTPFMTHTLPVTPLVSTGAINCLGNRIVGDGQISSFPPLPLPEP